MYLLKTRQMIAAGYRMNKHYIYFVICKGTQKIMCDNIIHRQWNYFILIAFQTAKAFLPAMIEHNDGHIVTIASMAGHVGVAKLVDYCSSKAAACGFDESLRVELEARGIKGVRTSLICPYFIRSTGMFEEVNSR